MTIQQIKDLIEHNHRSIAFIVGNGINRYPNNPVGLSWEQLLIRLWQEVTGQNIVNLPQGIAITEFYDILELENHQNLNLQERFCELMQGWTPLDHHRIIVRKIRDWEVPLLTANFEGTLENTYDFPLKRIAGTGFSDFYPWSSYYGTTDLNLPTDGFGIWHINGMIHYTRSIRLGLGHYMGSVEKARGLIHNGDEDSLFSGKDQAFWRGYRTWLHIIFNKSLFIFGFGLEENETFIRWLLIERKRYFQRFPERNYQGWYLMKRSQNGQDGGKKLFLQGVGITVIEVDSYDDVYKTIWE
jgi:hypothetical protein